MVSIYRNTNLEEIHSDAFLGFEFLMYQTKFQKFLLIFGRVFVFALNAVLMFVFGVDSLVAIFICLPFSIPFIIFGCNYNEDLTLFRYLYLTIKDPCVKLVNRSTEDIHFILSKKDILDRIIDENETKSNGFASLKKVFIILGCFIFLTIAIVIIGFVLGGGDKAVHHTI